MKRAALTIVALIALSGPSLARDWHRAPNGGWGRGVPYVTQSPPSWAYRLPPRMWVPPRQVLPDSIPPAVYPCDMTTGRGLCGPKGGYRGYPSRGSSFWTAPGVIIDGRGRDTRVDIYGHNNPGGVELWNRRRW
jgi:hypothetical protein